MMNRRHFLTLFGAAAVFPSTFGTNAVGRAVDATRSLSEAPIELGGEWAASPIEAVSRVLPKIRSANLSGLRLLSDRQPAKLRVENHLQGLPAIWLQADRPDTATIIVNIGAADWCKLAYQFGHELGHVLCNSWQFSAKPQPPTQWLEEAMVEAFSIRGLGRLAVSWEQAPPFAGDASFAQSIHRYRSDLVDRYQNGGDASHDDVASWFRANRAELEMGRPVALGPAISGILKAYQSDLPANATEASCVDDLGALNRWPERSGIPLEIYLERWAASCAQIGAPARLPSELRKLFRL